MEERTTSSIANKGIASLAAIAQTPNVLII